MANCPSEELLAALSERRWRGAERSAGEAHTDGCRDCRTVLAELARARSDHTDATAPTALAPPRAAEAALPEGSLIGRFVIERLIGTGGMGVVYLAFDPELGRKVALKLVRARVAGTEGRAGLVREA